MFLCAIQDTGLDLYLPNFLPAYLATNAKGNRVTNAKGNRVNRIFHFPVDSITFCVCDSFFKRLQAKPSLVKLLT